MSRIAWHRPARIPVPPLPSEKMVVPAPPPVTAQNGVAAWITMLLPALSTVSIAGYMLVYHKLLLTILAIGIVLTSVVVTAFVRSQTTSAARRARDRQHDRYLEHLASVRQSARNVAAVQRAAAVWQWPSPERLWAIAWGRRRVWERRPGDPDFLRVRVGTGRGPLASPVQLNMRPDTSVEYDPALRAAAERLVEDCASVGGQPAVIDLDRAGVVSLVGPRDLAQSVGRAMLCHLTALHAPDDVLVMVSADAGAGAWAWAGWLPHTRDSGSNDVAQWSLVGSGYDTLAGPVERELTRALAEQARHRGRPLAGGAAGGPSRRVVVVIDGFGPQSPWAHSQLGRRLVEAAGPASGLTVIALVRDTAEEPTRVDVRVLLNADGRLSLEASDPKLIGQVLEGTADRCPVPLAEATARAMAPLTLTDEPAQVLARTVPLSEMFGLGDLDGFDPRDGWVRPGDPNVLCAPVGVAADGSPLVLDLKEAGQGGMGPHGLIVGATGSGKSELLRTLLTGLTIMHPPELLSMVLVDFKGGATFAGMTGLPHVAGLITNLVDDLALVDRVRDALTGEQQRRQRLLRDAGNVDSVRDYQVKQAAGGLDVHGRPLEPLPYLFVIVDEFGELLSLRPDFINLFVQIGRVGRSLGIHLLLATQRLEEGRLRGLESHLSYRLCLRTFSAAESRVVIGTTDAYLLPQLPGSAYLKVGESVYQQFRVAHVSAPHQDPGARPAGEVPGQGPADEIFQLRLREAPDADSRVDAAQPQAAPALPLPPDGRTQMQVIVDRMQRYGQPVHQVWLPPLPSAIPLDLLLGTPAVLDDGRGLQSSLWAGAGSLSFPVGVADLPLRQEQRPLTLDFSATNPHLLLVGAPQSGKSTFVRTLMLSGMLTHTPNEMQFYCLDYGGGALHSLAEAPHVSGVAVRGEAARAMRVLNEVRRLISVREQDFRDRGIRSIAEARVLRDNGEKGFAGADVLLVVDGWGVLKGELPDVDAYVLDIAARGPGVGVHLVIAANRWGDIRMNVRDSVSTRLELRLNDPGESEVNRQVSRLLQQGSAGSGVCPPGLLFQTALPRLDGTESSAGLGDASDDVVAKIIASWPGAAAPPLRMLPTTVFVKELAGTDRDASGPGALVAIGERDLGPVLIDLTQADQHCVVVGDGGAGKSAFLQTWMASMADQQTANELRFMVVDYRRALMGVVPEPYVGAYASDASAAAEYARQLAAGLAGRLPPPDISRRDLRRRDWWTGPELYLVIDDYDLVNMPGTESPIAPLVSYIPHAREIGFHIVLSRRSGGMARALSSDPVISRIREAGAAALILSSDPREGALFGDQRGAEMPPGRGVLVRRGRERELVQVLLNDDYAEEAGV